ncbi:uncharacterized protein LOC143220793 [Lasioglossum baleicum]|uniref:uncharacterized protein LOC143220793 n=1 Tax=Lasioglossum baleicum TaxID=434251 RepID=UPI003FCE4FE4
MDEDAFLAAVHVADWPSRPAGDVEAQVTDLQRAVTEACVVSMPRVPKRPRRSVYWWDERLTVHRVRANRARRRYTRARRRVGDHLEEEVALRTDYRRADKSLLRAIKRARAAQWNELLETLYRDAWGRPYRVVLGRMRRWAPPLIESMEPAFAERVFDVLFPASPGVESQSEEARRPATRCEVGWTDDLGVTTEELGWAIGRMGARSKAPGPDGVPGRVCVIAANVLGGCTRALFNERLESGRFPKRWKRAKVVLLPMPSKPQQSPPASRPICLLDEGVKLLERLLARRLTTHLSTVGPDLDDRQFRFRQGRSTIDALLRVKCLSELVVRRSVVICLLSDLISPMHSTPCPGPLSGLHWYLEYPGRDGTVGREVYCGVPQVSVLGPILWDLAFDELLHASLPGGVSVTCYADDTLVAASGTPGTPRLAGKDPGHLVPRREEEASNTTRKRNNERGRKGRPHRRKNKVPRLRPGRPMDLRGTFPGTRPPPAEDGRSAVSAAAQHRRAGREGAPTLRRCHPLDGPVRSTGVGGRAGGQKEGPRQNGNRLVTGGHQDRERIPYTLARGGRRSGGLPPMNLLAAAATRTYGLLRRYHGGNPGPGPEELEELEEKKREIRRFVTKRWQGRLRTFRHGCFGEYLHKIGKEVTPVCWHCEAEVESAQHILEECPAWALERREFQRLVRWDLSLHAIVPGIAASDRVRRAVASFCEQVMQRKEEAEWSREKALPKKEEDCARKLEEEPSESWRSPEEAPVSLVRGSIACHLGPPLCEEDGPPQGV